MQLPYDHDHDGLLGNLRWYYAGNSHIINNMTKYTYWKCWFDWQEYCNLNKIPCICDVLRGDKGFYNETVVDELGDLALLLSYSHFKLTKEYPINLILTEISYFLIN
jgi:hypothetical protein